MKYKVIKSSEIEEKDFGYIKVKQLLNQEDIDNISVSIVKIDGKNKKIINESSDAVYYVLEGSGAFNIDGDEVSVEIEDLVFIPKGTLYFDTGKMIMLSINSPRFNRDTIKYLD